MSCKVPYSGYGFPGLFLSFASPGCNFWPKSVCSNFLALFSRLISFSFACSSAFLPSASSAFASWAARSARGDFSSCTNWSQPDSSASCFAVRPPLLLASGFARCSSSSLPRLSMPAAAASISGVSPIMSERQASTLPFVSISWTSTSARSGSSVARRTVAISGVSPRLFCRFFGAPCCRRKTNISSSLASRFSASRCRPWAHQCRGELPSSSWASSSEICVAASNFLACERRPFSTWCLSSRMVLPPLGMAVPPAMASVW
mmetsp:Transcript_16914/g.49500  ORF Transcript_16914/g.49500 Transcript_16914/m.49500 type:complete len:261 (-) Transcript_16914:38-820(-)